MIELIEYWPYLAAFFGMFFTDVFYTYYLGAIQEKRAIASANWAAIVYVIASMLIIGYTDNPWLLIPAILGAWLGTYIGIKIR